VRGGALLLGLQVEEHKIVGRDAVEGGRGAVEAREDGFELELAGARGRRPLAGRRSRGALGARGALLAVRLRVVAVAVVERL